MSWAAEAAKLDPALGKLTGSLKFRPDIEGLRALAIVPVVLYHAFPALLPGGFVGVDVFFVISGFLITSLLMQRLQAGRYSIVAFYGARIRRIFPALFVMLALVTPLAVWLLSPAGLQEFGRTLGATAVFFSNMELYRTTGYFDTATDLKPLVHTWSLAVEEQYYIVFPLLLAFLFKRWRKGIAPVLLGVALVSLALSIWWLRVDAALSFYSALSRTYELMLGSLLAVGAWGGRLPHAVRELAACAGLLCIVLACTLFTSKMPFPGVAALLPCVGAALLIWAGSGEQATWVGRLVSVAPMRWIGALSFSLYLWHWPVLVFTRHWLLGEPSALQASAAIAVSVLLAWASLKWVEAPVRRAAVTDKLLLAAGAACVALGLGVAALLHQAGPGLQGLTAEQSALYAAAQDTNPERRRCHGRSGHPIPYEQRCQFGDAGAHSQVAVWADSHGAELALALGERWAGRGLSVAQITASSCPPALAYEPPTARRCAEHNAATLAALSRDPRVGTVILAARWHWYLEQSAPPFEAGVLQSVRALSDAGKRVIIVTPFPVYAYPVPAALGALSRRGQLDSSQALGQARADYDRKQAAALKLMDRLGAEPGVTLLSAAEVFCATGNCLLMSPDGQAYYFDDNHLSMVGARALAAHLDRFLGLGSVPASKP